MRLLFLLLIHTIALTTADLQDAQAKESHLRYGRFHNVRVPTEKHLVLCRILPSPSSVVVLATTNAPTLDETAVHTALGSYGLRGLRVKSVHRISRTPKASSAFLGKGSCYILSYSRADSDLTRGGRP